MIEVKFVLCRLIQAFGDIEMCEKIGDKVVAVDAEKKEKIRTTLSVNTKPADVVWLRFRK